MMSVRQCRMMWASYRAQSAPLLVSAVWKRRNRMRYWAHRYTLRRGWNVVLTDGSYIRKYLPTGQMVIG